MDVKNHNLGGMIAQSCKGCEIAGAILLTQICNTEIQVHEVKVCQFRVKSEVQTLRTESGMDFKSDPGSLGLYLQHIFKNQPLPTWVKRSDRFIQISAPSCARSTKAASMLLVGRHLEHVLAPPPG